MSEYISAKDVARMVRGVLKKKLPQQKFFVTSTHSAVRVRWIDGVLPEDVEKEVGHFHGEYYDMNADVWLPNGSKFLNDHIFFERQITPDFLGRVVAHIAERFGVPPPAIKVSTYDKMGYIDRTDPANNAFFQGHGERFDHYVDRVLKYYRPTDDGIEILAPDWM